jgi:hypothetical protein
MNLEKMRREFLEKRYGKVEMSASEALALVDDLIKAESAFKVCQEILEIMHTYHEQEESGQVDTPGGIEHLGDVWDKFLKWEKILLNKPEQAMKATVNVTGLHKLSSLSTPSS